MGGKNQVGGDRARAFRYAHAKESSCQHYQHRVPADSRRPCAHRRRVRSHRQAPVLAADSNAHCRSINWQSGPFGGQAMIGLPDQQADLTGVETKTSRWAAAALRVNAKTSRCWPSCRHHSRATRAPIAPAKATLAARWRLSEDFCRARAAFVCDKVNWNRQLRGQCRHVRLPTARPRARGGVQYESGGK